MPGAQAASGPAVAAVGDIARRQRAMSEPAWSCRRREDGQIRLTETDPPLMMPKAQSPRAGWAHAAGHLARGTPEHWVTGLEDEIIPTELGTDGGHQLFPQTRRSSR